MTPVRLVASFCALTFASAALVAPAAASGGEEFVNVTVGEVPTAVAVSDTGVIAASLYDAQAVALIDSTGAVNRVSLGCSPSDVDISPSGDTAWSVCQGSENVIVIDVASGEVGAASVGATGLDDIVYLPAVDQLLIGSLEGQIITVSEVSTGGYLVTGRVVMPEWRPTQLAPVADGTWTYAITDAGDLLFVGIEMGGQVVLLHRATSERVFLSITLAPDAIHLYGAVSDFSTAAVVTSVEALDLVTGDARQRVDLAFSIEGSTAVQVIAGYRAIYVATGLSAQTMSGESGLLTLPVSESGVVGAVESAPVGAANGAAVALSHGGGSVAFGTTNSTVVGARVSDQPYPRAISFSANGKGKVLRVRGTTTSLPPGTRISIFVKDLTAKKPRFVKQKATATSDATGAFTWRGKAVSARMAIYVSGGGVRSETVTVRAR